MFGFGKKKVADSAPTNKRGSADKDKINDQLAKLGLIGIPGIDGDDADDLSDGDLENELMDILGEEEITPTEDKELQQLLQDDEPPVAPKRNHSNSTKVANSASGGQLPDNIPPATAPALANKALPVSDSNANTEDIFKATPPPSSVTEALQQRLEKYKNEAEKAQNAGDASKSRRMGRIVKQYEDAIKSHERSRDVLFDELPTPPGFAPIPSNYLPSTKPSTSASASPPVALKTPAPEVPVRPVSPNSSSPNIASPPLASELPPPKRPSNQQVSAATPEPVPATSTAPVSDASVEQNELLQSVYAKEKACKEAALQAKHAGRLDQAKEFLKFAKGYGKVISDYQSGQETDLSSVPPLPDLTIVTTSEVQVLPAAESSSRGFVQETLVQAETETAAGVAAESLPIENIFNAPPPPSTIMEAMEQRLEKYRNEVEKAKEKADGGKTRRMGRIVKQYEDAIKSYKSGRPVEFEELPTPPGFAPIPVNKPAAPAPAAAGAVASPSASAQNVPQKPTPPKHQSSINRGENKPGTKLTLQEKQLNTILTRQRQFKEAALGAKQRGEMEQAKEYLRTAKGFDKLIQVSQAGLPVDMATLPAPPESVAALEAEDFELVSSSDCIPASGSTADIFSKLEADLREQMTVCMRTRAHLKAIGDVGSANRFEQMAIESKKDLDALRLAVKNGHAIPKYHYETRIFSITECNSDLGEDDIEISILKGVNFKTTADVDTFIKVELPYPSAEEVQTNKTAVVKNSNNPDYNATYKMTINRGARNFPRFIHRHGVKLEVWSKGGFLRGSTQIGVANVKLNPLETKCTLHDAFDVMDGRKAVGKLEVKVRLRDPVLTKEISQKKQKWLSLDRV